MDIEYGMAVYDKNGKKLGDVGKIVNDMWTGEPRKFMVMVEDETDAVFFTPDQVEGVSDSKVTLNYALENLEQTE